MAQTKINASQTTITAEDIGAAPVYSTMPTAAVGYLDKIVQYTGATDSTYTNGYFYKCVSDGAVTPTYSWTAVQVQASSGGLPSQTGNANKFLTTDGTDASWADTINATIKQDYYSDIQYGTSPITFMYLKVHNTTTGQYSGSMFQMCSIPQNNCFDLIFYTQMRPSGQVSGQHYIRVGNNAIYFASDNWGDLGRSSEKFRKVYTYKLNNGSDITVPNTTGTMVVADYTGATAGQVLTLDNNLSPVWSAPGGGSSIQVSSLPTAGISEEGNIYQYIGTTDQNYTNGYFYQCQLITIPGISVDGASSYTPGYLVTVIDPVLFEQQMSAMIPSLDFTSYQLMSFNYDYYTEITSVTTEVGTATVDIMPGGNPDIRGMYDYEFGTQYSGGNIYIVCNSTMGGMWTDDYFDVYTGDYPNGVLAGTIQGMQLQMYLGVEIMGSISGGDTFQLNIADYGGGWRYLYMDPQTGDTETTSIMSSSELASIGITVSQTGQEDVGQYFNVINDPVQVTTSYEWVRKDTQPSASKPSTMPVLSSGGWTNNSQTVNVAGVTPTNIVIVSPAPASASDYGSAGIICTTQGVGTLTFTCASTPSNNITVNVVIL